VAAQNSQDLRTIKTPGFEIRERRADEPTSISVMVSSDVTTAVTKLIPISRASGPRYGRDCYATLPYAP
jgi:hypothetical protein